MDKYIKNYTLIQSPLQNIIPIRNGMYIIAYADNSGAQLLSAYMIDTDDNRRILENMITIALNCPSLNGTLKSIQGYYTLL